MSTALEQRFGLGGKVAAVTGAGKGLGRAIAMTFAEAGAAVAVQDLQADTADAVAAEIRDAGGKAISVAGDASKQEAIDAFLEQTQQDLGSLDIVVNNAGIYPFTDFLKIPTEEWDQVLDLNLRGTFFGTQKAGRMMKKQRTGGRIINLASVQAFRPTGPGVAAYDVSKAGVVMLTKAAALELGPLGIAVNAVGPGTIATPGTQPLIDQKFLGDPKERVPFTGRWGIPSDVADVILFLAGPAAAYVTGQTIIIDGGFLLR